jgi:hypothetical protein
MKAGDECLLPRYISDRFRDRNSWSRVLGKMELGYKLCISAREYPFIACVIHQLSLNGISDDASLDAEHSVNGSETAFPATANNDMKRGCRWTIGAWQCHPLSTMRTEHRRVDEARLPMPSRAPVVPRQGLSLRPPQHR